MYDTLVTIKGMSKEDFREMRERRLYDLTSNSGDPYYPRNEMKPIKEELYDKLAAKNTVCPQHPLNMEFLRSNEYFAEAIRVATHLGLCKLMVVQQDYDIPIIHQLFAIVVFDEDDLRSFQWMTGPTTLRSNFKEFGVLLGYDFVEIGRAHV